jgi:hypothetical protein
VECLLILDGHSSYSFFMCTESGIETFCLPSHKISVLQPVDRSSGVPKEGGGGFGVFKTPRNSEVSTKSNRIANWAKNV